MVANWFLDWASRHEKRFGLDNLVTVDWRDQFERLGVSEQEADSASVDLLANSPPSYKRNHLAAVLGWIKNRRTGGNQTNQPNDFGVCQTCFSVGRVVVPWKLNQDRSWDGVYTNTAYCRCALGQWYRERHQELLRHKTPMTLDRYEEIVPEWKWLMGIPEN